MKEQTRPEGSQEADKKLAKNFEVLLPEPFRQDFCAEADYAVASSPIHGENPNLPQSQRPSIGLEAMWIEFFGSNQRAIFDSAYKAAKAGFDVELHRDWYSDTILDGDLVFLPPTKFAKKAQGIHRKWVYGYTQKRLNLLEDAGATIVPINVPPNPIDIATYLLKGRDHKKIIFIKGKNKMVAYVGGMNLAEEHFRELDFMVKIDDPRIVESLMSEFRRARDNKRTTNGRVSCTEDTEILVDTGRQQSLILEQAIYDVDAAEYTVYVSTAFLPSGEFLKALGRAKNRGVHIAYITSDPDFAGGLLKLQEKLSDMRNRRKEKIPVMFPEQRLVHAKALVVDGKRAIIGSHNFIDMRHEELSMRSENPELVQNVTEFLRRVSGGNLDTELAEDFTVQPIE